MTDKIDGLYVKGDLNKVADALSCYYESDTHLDIHNTDDYVHADQHINPDSDDLPF
jgi:hypothetical protein